MIKKIYLFTLVTIIFFVFYAGDCHKDVKVLTSSCNTEVSKEYNHEKSADVSASFNRESIQSMDLFVSGTHGVTEFRIPAMITTLSGTVLAVCDARVDRPGDVPNNVDQVIRRSLDNGQTWDNIRTIVDFPNKEGAADPQLIQDTRTGRIFLFYAFCPGRNDVTSGPNRVRRYLQLQYIYSDDDGITWSLPLVAEHGLKKEGWHSMWPSPGRGTQLKNGRIIVPVTAFETIQPSVAFSHFIYSDDHGKTWNLSGRIGSNTTEATLVEIDENTLLVNARNQFGGKRRIFFSSDSGKSWAEVNFSDELIDPGCQGSLIRVQDGGRDVLVFSNPYHPKRRLNMTVKVSYDNGKTWPYKRTIHAGPSAYSCLTVMPDGEIALLYENGEKGPYEKISFIKVPLDWITNKN